MHFLLLLLLFFGTNFTCASQIEIDNNSDIKQITPAKILLETIGTNDLELREIAQILKKSLEKSEQFIVTLREVDTPRNKKEVTGLFQEGFGLIIFLNHTDDKKALEWRLYDATEAVMVDGKRMYKRGKLLRGHAYNLADDLWPKLTKQLGSFSSKLAYIKIKNGFKKNQNSFLCICDTDGTNELEFRKNPGNYVALYWNNNLDFPSLICSELTKYNVRLISISLDLKKKSIFNFKGTCVGISLSTDNNKAVYCRSGNIWSHIYDKSQKKGTHSRLISNDGKNIYPILLHNDDIIFCTDSKSLRKGFAKAKGPQICYFHAEDKSFELITQDGYCLAPSYCNATNKLAYSKKIDGKTQLFICDLQSKIHEQLTKDEGNKIDSCWSPCGNYLIFCYQSDKISRIGVIHIATKKRLFITSAKDYCISPSWSAVFPEFPSL